MLKKGAKKYIKEKLNLLKKTSKIFFFELPILGLNAFLNDLTCSDMNWSTLLTKFLLRLIPGSERVSMDVSDDKSETK